MDNLNSTEWKVLELIHALGKKTSIDKIIKESKMNKNTVFSILERLSKKETIKIKMIMRREVRITIAGAEALTRGLPERRMLRIILRHNGKMKIEDLIKMMKEENVNIVMGAIGWARKKGWIKIKEGKIITNFREEPPKGVDEKILEEIGKDEMHKNIDGIDRDLLETVEILRKRGFLEIDLKPKIMVFLTIKGEELLLKRKIEEEITVLTRDHIINKSWKERKIKKYDVTTVPKKVYYGKRHFLSEFIDQIKEMLFRLGFKEIFGSLVELEFWNFDILLYPQDSPIRDCEKPIILKHPSFGNIRPVEIISVVKRLHEERNKWGESRHLWSEEYAKRLILRTSTLPVLLKYIANKNNTEETIKIFCIDRVFRAVRPREKKSNENIELSIIYSCNDANVGNLVELLEILLRRLRIEKYVLKPGYLPYTEPTFEVFISDKGKDWTKCIKMGKLRNEISHEILRIDNPVLVWNVNVSKIALIYFNLRSSKEIFLSDLDKLQEISL